MRQKLFSAIVFTALLGACTLEPPLLNSERILERYGSFGIAVAPRNSDVRRSNLYSGEGNERICRTYAVVQFSDAAASRVGEAHTRILDGESIGTTLKAAGWQVHKLGSHIGNLSLVDPEHTIAALMRLQESSELAMHAYQLHLQKNSQSIYYATIIEVHHPDFLSESDLRRLYGASLAPRLTADEIEALEYLVLDSG